MTTDYQQFTTKATPKAERRKLDIGDIWSNAAKCLGCTEIVRSKNRHDYVTCSCERVAVDGGSWYAKRACNTAGMYEDLIEYYDDAEDHE